MKYVFALAVALILNACANLLMKVGMTEVDDSGGLLKDGALGAVRTVLLSPVLITGLVCFALNAAFYMFALQSQTLKISLAYPVMVGGGHAIIATVAYFLLNERMTLGQWGGVILILAGVLLIAARTSGHPVESA